MSDSPSPTPASPTPDGYQLLDIIGEGGMGVVWHARDLSLQRDVAVKLLKPRVSPESLAVQRFLAEARLTGQLQHPGIPPVHELGTLSDGRPFLAMKLVKGQNLHELLKQRPNASHDRGRFLAIFEQVCHAVGYAHAHNVIHRDLKPGNVMVGTHGEVQVMDWGLAKVLGLSCERQRAETDDPDATIGLLTEIDTPARADSATRTGSVLGTPAYMAPEQAGGEIRKLDARSDVFGLGAMLCEILTGRPPYWGADSNEIRLQAVRWETAEAFARLEVCGAEPELIALCKRCLAKEQADRPADGNAVAQEVAAIRQAAEDRARRAELEKAQALVRAAEQHKRRRLVVVVREAEQAKRRRLAAVLGGAVAAVLVVGLAVSLWQMRRPLDAEKQATAHAEQAEQNAAQARAERDEKEKEQQRAEAALAAETKARAAERQARDQALAALRVMTDELVERQLARGHALTEENKEFLRKVIAQFEGFAKITADDAESRAIRAEGYFRVGLMRYRLGDLGDAEAAYRQALKLQEQLAAQFPTRPDYRQALAASHNNFGNLLAGTGRPREAEEAYRAARKLYEQLVADFPTRPDFRQDLANSCNNLGVLLAGSGQLKEAEEAYRQALKLRKQLADEFPTRPDFRQALALSHNNLGNLLASTGRLKDAEDSYHEALKLYEQLAAEFPTRPDCRQALAGSHNNLGLLLRATGRPKEAEEAFRASLELRDRLVGEFPSRPEYRQELAASHNNLGILLAVTGRLREAEESFRAAVKLQDRLAAEFPNQPDLRNDLAATLGNLAILFNQRRDFATAKEYLAQAEPHHLAALKANPRHPTYRQFYRNNLLALVQAHAGLLDPAAAVQTAQTARDLGWDGAADAYDAACALALCIPIVEKHEQLDADKRKAAVQFYGDAAMKLLREAVAKGFKDAAHMKQDSDLAPLRQRPDFQKLLKELESQH
jgi:tetratricopeptide (TPR) repeat protein